MTDTGDLAEQVADDPELETALSAVVEVDTDRDSWTFEDVPVDTGTFGRLVNQGTVEKADDGYRLADPDAVRSAIEAGQNAGERADPDRPSFGELRGRLTDGVDVSGVSAGRLPAIGGTLAVVALFVWTRAFVYPEVFRAGNVVLTANDPYYYRYVVDRLLRAFGGPLDLGALVGVPTGEPLFVATLWWVASLFGGGQTATGTVLAWYPVVAALFTGGIVYLIGSRVLGDGRVGAVAAASLALVPGYAFRTSLGFADHHAFDYLWLTATVAVLAWAVTLDADDPFATANARAGTLLGACLAGQTLAWEGSPLLLLPVAGYLAVAVPLDVSEDRSPLRANAPVLLGTAVAAVAVSGAHLALGWHETTVAVVPALLFASGLGLAGVGELVRRRDLTARALVAAEAGGPVVGLVALAVVLPGLVGQLLSGIGFLLFRSNVAEKAPTFTIDHALGLELLGPFVLLALPVVGWGAVRAASGDRQWLALSVYGWWLLFLTALQLRFAGHLAPLLALFTGVFVVWTLARVGLTAPPAPVRRASEASEGGDGARDGRTGHPPESGTRRVDPGSLTIRSGVATLVVVALVVGVSGLYLPDEVESGVVDDETYHTAVWMESYADDRGWRYPESYVFSRWGANRVYNYFVSGESRSYSNAQDNYREFVYDDDPAAWYDRMRGGTGFVVIEPLPRRPGTIQQHLYVTYGSRWAKRGYDAVSHYRAVYASSSTRKKVFTLVPGATVTGTASANTTVEARTTVEVPNESFLYRQQAETGTDGEYRLVVPYPADYELTAGNETWNASVPETAVRNGTTVRVGR